MAMQSQKIRIRLKAFDYRLIDPVIILDEWDRWEQRWSALFLKGEKIKKEAD